MEEIIDVFSLERPRRFNSSWSIANIVIYNKV